MKKEAAPSKILISMNEALLIALYHYLGMWCLPQCTLSGKQIGTHAHNLSEASSLP